MNNELKTRQMICAEVLKQESLIFRATAIANSLSLQRQLIYYHLGKLVENGLLEKQGTRYAIIDKDKLIDFMIEAGSNSGERRGVPTVFDNVRMRDINKLIDVIVMMRALNLDESIDVKIYVARELKEAADQLMTERKYLLEKVQSPGSARKVIRKGGGTEEDWYNEVDSYVSNTIKYEWETPRKERVNEFIDKMQEED